MEQKNNIKKFPCMQGNINFVWNKIKDKGKFPHVFHKRLYLHRIFPSIDRKKTQINMGILNIMNTSLKEKRTNGLVVQIPPAAPFITMHSDNIRGRWRRLQRGSNSSMEGETRLQRGGGDTVYRGRDSSAEGQTRIQRGRRRFIGHTYAVRGYAQELNH
jgi:hypothetical protein